MSGWWVLAGWLLGVVLTWRTFAIGLLQDQERRHPRLPIDSGDRAFAAGFGCLQALVWPVSLPIRAAFRVATRGGVLTTPNEKAAADKAELEGLRRLAREHGLPMPGGDS